MLGVMGLLLVLHFPNPSERHIPATTFNRFGVVEGMWFPDVTCALGVGWERLIFNWAHHQPNGADEWLTFNVDQRWIDAARACNRELVALLKSTPDWATDGEVSVGVPRGLSLPLDDPNNLWANFVRRTVQHYAPQGVRHYIIWNEPDISPDVYGYEFAGDLEDYFLLLKVAYLVAKAVDPDVKIHLAGTTYWHDVNEGRQPYFERLIERMMRDPDAEQNGYYFDVVSLHIYFRSQTVFDITNAMRKMLVRHGVDKPFWINETNAAPTDDPAWQVIRPAYQHDLAQQAQFLLQSAAFALAAGVERVAVYKLYDQELPEGGESFGLLSPRDASPRPAYWAWQTVAREFANTRTAQLAQTRNVNAVRLRRDDGQQVWVLWARRDNAPRVRVQATGDSARLMRYDGTSETLVPTAGSYELTLAPARCTVVDGCFIGGEVLLLIQPDGASDVFELAYGLPFRFAYK